MKFQHKEEQKEHKRLFFAFEIDAPWPSTLPHGRLLQEKERHLTVAFLGQTNYSNLHPLLSDLPLPSFKIGLAGYFDTIQFLPAHHPKVVAWHALWLDDQLPLLNYVQTLTEWLDQHEFHPDKRDVFLPHVSICRWPFNFNEWRHAFQNIPLVLKHLHLYESIGQLHYQPIWSCPLIPPFEELDHTADIAFNIHGESIHQIFLHALTALAFKSPELLKYRQTVMNATTIDEVVTELNYVIARADADIGSSFKAVSFHGEIKQEANHTLSWEMIVDV